MSTANRSIARLPLDVFENLSGAFENQGEQQQDSESATNLRNAIVSKLRSVPKKSRSGTVVVENIHTVGALLRLPKTSLLRFLDPLLTYDECGEFYRRICLTCAPKSKSALQLLRSTRDITNLPVNEARRWAPQMRYLPTGLQPLDEKLRGGIRVSSVTEVVGCAGTGKTQIALQLVIMAAAFQQGSIYVDTEHKVSLSRLQEMATQRHWQQSTTSDGLAERDGGLFSYGGTEFCGNDMSCAGDRNPFIDAETQSSHSASQRRYETCQNVLENLTVHNPGNTAELHRTLASLEEEILLRNDSAADGKSGPSGTQHRGSSFPVRLLVLDSIAAPARRDFGSGSAPQRAAAVLQVAQMLKRLADQFQLAVLVINQVGASSDDNSTSRAALGTSWHHCVSTRIQLEQQRGNTSRSGIATGETPVVRRATVVKSNLVGDGEPIGFKVTTLGVVGE